MKGKIMNIRKSGWSGAVGVILLLIGGAVSVQAAPSQPYELEIPLGLDEDGFQVPKDNPLTKEKVALGRLLFFDKRMSDDNTISCSTCHIPAYFHQKISQGGFDH